MQGRCSEETGNKKGTERQDLIRGYKNMNRDYEIVWNVVKEKLPALKIQIEQVLMDMDDN